MPEQGPGRISSNDILRSVLETSSLHHRDVLSAIQQSSDLTDAKIDELRLVINELAIQNVQLNAAVKATNAGIERLDQTLNARLTQLTASIDGHLTVAREQSANIAQLIELAKLQSATVDRLLAKN